MIGIVGAGPVGLTAANLLGALGLPVVVFERNHSTSSEAKAISLDGESIRTMQRADLLDALRDVVLPGTGTRYYGASGALLFHAAGIASNGHPVKNPFAQPDLERALLASLDSHPQVEARFATEVVGIEQDADGVTVRTRDLAGEEEEHRCWYAFGCDGGRSTVRQALGIAMTGSSFEQRWIVIDTLEDPHDQRYAMHFGDPVRPHVVVPGRGRRCRYEFLLLPGELEDGRPEQATIEALLRPFREISQAEVERCTVYTFHALNADRWRSGRIFLLGDAAHMMPPFAGQGLNSGVRDAANLTWKLAEVLAGRAGDRLLDSYEQERRPHAQAMIDFSVRLGEVVMTRSRGRARVRDAAIGAMRSFGPTRRYLEEMRYAPRARYDHGLVVPREGDRLAGRLLPQPRVLLPDGNTLLLDEMLRDQYGLLAVGQVGGDGPVPPRHPLWELIRPVCLRVLPDDRFPYSDRRPTVADCDGSLRAALSGASGRHVLVRPDRFVVAAFAESEAVEVADAALAAIGASGRSPDGGLGSFPPEKVTLSEKEER